MGRRLARLGPVGERHPPPAAWAPLEQPSARDDFTAPLLAPCWISPRRRPARSWSLTRRPGRLTLTATGDSLDRPGRACRSGWTGRTTATRRWPAGRRPCSPAGRVLGMYVTEGTAAFGWFDYVPGPRA
ncbi:hypothetical protein [Streptomyces sp. NPDC048665]|uniref:beta-xylosidase family glycoside hydrolase n=1 Tax=Streptomyces sp. NPDC048665 TaxID=3155490 RepID=UPI0034231222